MSTKFYAGIVFLILLPIIGTSCNKDRSKTPKEMQTDVYVAGSRRESNPRPNTGRKSFLHAYSIINCRQ